MSEIISDGTTGFVVTDVKEASAAVRRVGELDRAAVRADAVRRFDRNRMVDDYVVAYERAIVEFESRR